MYKGKCLPFFQKSSFSVVNKLSDSLERRRPKIRIEDEISFLCIKVAKLGYYGGNPDKVREAPVTTILDVLHYETFEADYIETQRCLDADDQ